MATHKLLRAISVVWLHLKASMAESSEDPVARCTSLVRSRD